MANGDTTRLATTFVSSIRLTALVPAVLLQRPVTARLFVEQRDSTDSTLLSWSNALSFTVSPPPPKTPGDLGALQVTVTTRGSAADSALYGLLVGGLVNLRVAANDTVLVTGLPPGDRVVHLTDLPPECVLASSEFQTVTVQPGDTAHVAFAVTCTEHGRIRIDMHTTGDPVDPDGYTISLDNARRQSVPVNGTFVFHDLSSPFHSVRLDGLAENCWFSQPDFIYPRSVQLAEDSTVSVRYDLVCLQPGRSAITVQVNRSGDPFGYFLTPFLTRSDGLTRADAQGVFGDLTRGSYQVGITGGTPFHIQCSVTPPNPRTVTLADDATMTMVFNVVCSNN
jgi:hypothetical protein